MIIAVINQKGGVGKTTTAVNLADLAARAGYAVLLMDTDSQANCADALGLDSGPELYKLLVDEQPLESLVISSARPNLDLLRSDKSTLLAENIVQGRDFREYCLSNALDAYAYDLVLIDCAPSAHVLHTAAMVASDYILVPAELAQFAVKGVFEIQRTLKSIQRMTTTNCQLAGILPTKLNRSRDESHEQLSNLADIFGGLVWPPIPVDAKVEKANRVGKTLAEYNTQSPALIGYKAGQKRVGGYQQAFERLRELL